MIKSITAISLFFLALFSINVAAAQDSATVSINPSIIDEKAKARDIIEKTVKIKNNTSAQVEIYASVNDLNKEKGQQVFNDPAELDKATSLARWIEITRGVITLGPNEEKEIPLKIRVNLVALPGKYYAVISFASGPNRDAAAINPNNAKMSVNLEIEDNIVERLENNSFRTEKRINTEGQVDFFFTVKNIGNQKSVPKGKIFIYDRAEREVGELQLNEEGKVLEPETKNDFRAVWKSSAKFGKFKAKLDVEYGQKDMRNIQDTIYFWLLPWWILAIIGGLIVSLIISLMLLFIRLKNHNKIYHHHHQETKSAVINLKRQP